MDVKPPNAPALNTPAGVITGRPGTESVKLMSSATNRRSGKARMMWTSRVPEGRVPECEVSTRPAPEWLVGPNWAVGANCRPDQSKKVYVRDRKSTRLNSSHLGI